MNWKLIEETSIQVPFEGEYAQIACISRTSWCHPDQAKTSRFHKATQTHAQLIINAVNFHNRLVGLAKGLVTNADASGSNHFYIEVEEARLILAELERVVSAVAGEK